MILLSASVLAEARLVVRVQPANSALKTNVEGYIGPWAIATSMTCSVFAG